jgi:hypothetical protein
LSKGRERKVKEEKKNKQGSDEQETVLTARPEG